MVLQAFDLGMSGGVETPMMPYFMNDYAPVGASSYFTDMDANFYSQGRKGDNCAQKIHNVFYCD